jgi:hypothetical protein
MKTTGPGTEILGSKYITRNLLYVGIHHSRIDTPSLPILIVVLKQLFTGNILTLLDYFCQFFIF